ncbi:MAG: hypothetical protein LC676_06245 [Loktanella sp.]|nr:hypothetical protein [Loktanella sp.]
MMADDLDNLRDRYAALFTRHLSGQDEEHAAAMCAGMLQASLSHEAHRAGRMATAERLRDLADLIEHEPGEGFVQ